MAVDGAAMSAAVVSLGQSIGAYQFFLPPLREVRKAGPNDRNMRGDVRLGQLAAGVVTVAVGAMLGYLVQSRVPVYVAVVMGLVVAALYEMALRGEGLFE